MTGTPLLDEMLRKSRRTLTVAVTESHAADGIKDRKLVLVTKNQADRL
jgi:hypothetical protein